MIIVKIYLGISLELLRAVWGLFSFRQFLASAYTSSQGLLTLSNVVSANYRVLICCTCHFQSRSLFSVYLASSVCKSLQCLISTLTQGGEGGHLFRLTCSVVLWGGRNTANKYHWHIWGVLTVSGPRWVCPRSRVCFLSLHCSGSRLLCQELSEAGPGLHALVRSKPLRFRFSGTPQRCRLGDGPAFCACPRSEQLR